MAGYYISKELTHDTLYVQYLQTNNSVNTLPCPNDKFSISSYGFCTVESAEQC
jgi:hypothetical protein